MAISQGEEHFVSGASLKGTVTEGICRRAGVQEAPNTHERGPKPWKYLYTRDGTGFFQLTST